MGRTRKGKSLEAPIRDVLITTPSMLAIMLPILFIVQCRQQKSGGRPPGTISQAFPKMLENAPSQISFS